LKPINNSSKQSHIEVETYYYFFKKNSIAQGVSPYRGSIVIFYAKYAYFDKNRPI
jgi:hypothetical protein